MGMPFSFGSRLQFQIWRLLPSRRLPWPPGTQTGAFLMPANNSLLRTVNHKVLGRGRPSRVYALTLCARVLKGHPAAAERGR